MRRARRRGEGLAAVTIALPASTDPAAVAFASRRGGEPLFVLEQPDAGGAALAALGCVRAIEASGPDRFAEVAAAWRRLSGDAAADPPDGPPGAGPVALGGFAFAPDGGGSAAWEGFAPGSLHVPEVALARRDGEVRLTLCALARPDDTAADLVARVEARMGELRSAALPLLDPSPATPARVASAMPPEHYEAAVERAVERIAAGGCRRSSSRARCSSARGARTTPPRSTASCARRSRRASCSAWRAASAPSPPPAPSC